MSLFIIGNVEESKISSLEEAQRRDQELRQHVEWELAWDGGTGKASKPEPIRQARPEEIEYCRKLKVYIEVAIQECIRAIGQQPIGVRWVDISKQDGMGGRDVITYEAGPRHAAIIIKQIGSRVQIF